MATPEPTTIERRPAPQPAPRLSPMARRVAAHKLDGRRLVDEVPSGGIRPGAVAL